MGARVPVLAAAMKTETITWHDPRSDKPDSDTTVLLHVPGADEPVWPGHLDGETWTYAEGAPVGRTVKAWAEMPEGAKP